MNINFNYRIIRLVNRGMAVAITAMLLLIVVIQPAHAETSGNVGNSISWSIEDGKLVLTGKGNIPNFSESSMAPWYTYRNQIYSVNIGKDITGIGNLAFYGLSEVNYVSVPSSVKYIGELAFASCAGMTGIELSEGLESIGADAFNRCESLTYVNLPNSLKTIGDQAFYLCTSLYTVSVPSGVNDFGTGTFAYCSSLMQANIECKIDSLPAWTFLGCTSLIEVSLPENMVSVGEDSFYNCDRLDSVYYSGDNSTGNTIEQQIQIDIPGFTGVQDGSSSDLSDDISETESVTNEDGIVVETERQVVTTGNASIELNTEHTKPADGSNDSYNFIINATVSSEDGWTDFQESVSKKVAYANRLNDNNTTVNRVTVNVNMYFDGEIPEEVLTGLAGTNTVLNITSSDNTTYSIDCSLLAQNSIKDYNLKFSLTRNNEPTKKQKALIGDADSYLINFEETVPLNVVVKVRVGITYARDVATIYQKTVMKDWQLLQSVMVDDYGYAEFYLGGVDNHTDYMVALNVQGIDADSVIVPESLSSEYGGLVDENGTKYVVTGTKSSWGITFGQLTLIVIGIIVISAVIIGVVVKICFKYKFNKRERN